MKYFELTENIGDVEVVFRVLFGSSLLGVMLMGHTSFIYTTVFPMIGTYFILTAITRWDPVGYAIQIILRVLASMESKLQAHNSTRHIKSV